MAQGGLGSLWGAILGAFGAGPASGTIEAITGTALEAFLGPSLNEAKQYAKAYIRTSKNHDLERSLRFAALLACLHLILEQKSHEEGDAAMERGKPRDTFCELARKWVHGQLFALGEVQDGAHRESVAAYQVSLNTALASQPDPRDAARAAEDRKTAETNMWKELVDALPDQQFPTDFEARFKREDGDGWFDYFIIFLREALKNQDNARHAFFIGGLSDLQNAVTRIESMLKDVPTAERNAMAVVDEFVRRGLAAPAHSSGLVEITVISLAKQLNPKLGYDMDLALRELQNAVDTAVALRTLNERSSSNGQESRQLVAEKGRRLRSMMSSMADMSSMAEPPRSLSQIRLSDLQAVSYVEDPFVTSILAEVVRRNDEGRLEAGASAVDLGLARIEEYAVTRRVGLSYDIALLQNDIALRTKDIQSRYATRVRCISLLKIGINQDLLRRNVQAVVDRIETLVALDRPRRPAWAPDFLEYHYEFYQQGRDKGINLPLEVAMAMAQRMRATAKTDDERGTALNLLGRALQTLGTREAGTARLEEAVTAYREALKELTRDRVPLDWAMTQHGLAECLAALAERSPTPGPILADAITHMQNAVDGYQQVGDEYWTPIAEQRLAELKAKAQMPRG